MAALASLALGLLAACAPQPLTVELRIRYSAFEPAAVTVPSGVPVTFLVVNEDPIDHEWLVGDAEFHARHREGTERHHGATPDELSVAALSTGETTITFAQPGTLTFVCHLPGHEEYGMSGVLHVI